MSIPALHRRNFIRVAALSVSATALAGCESLADIGTLFDRPPPPLPGERRPVFPEGVQRDRSVPQPMNSPLEAQNEPAPAPATTKKRRTRD